MIRGVHKELYFWREVLDVKFQEENLFQVDRVFRDISRIKQHIPNQAFPMTPQILMEMFTFLDMSRSEDITYWRLFLFMFFLMARKSNMVPNSVAGFDSDEQLIKRDVKILKAC